MAFIFANDPGQLANQRLAYDRTNIDLAQADRAARQKAIDDYNRQMMEQQRQDQQDSRQEANQQYQFADLTARNQQQQAATDTQKYQFQQGETDKSKSAEESKREFDINTGLQSKQFDFTKGQASTKESEDQLKQLVGMFKTDSVPSDSDVTKLFPALSPAQKDYAKQVAQQQRAYEDQQTTSAAAQATHLVRALGGVAAAVPNTEKVFGIPFWNNAKAAVNLTEDQAFKHLEGDKNLKAFADSLRWDTASQQFFPVLRAAATNATIPAGQPTGEKPGFNFVTPQPAAAPTSQLTPDIMKGAQRVASREEAMNKPAGAVSILPDGSVVRSKGTGTSDMKQVFPAPTTSDITANRAQLQVTPAPAVNPFAPAPVPMSPMSKEKGTGSPYVNVGYYDQRLQTMLGKRAKLLADTLAWERTNPDQGASTGTPRRTLELFDQDIANLMKKRADTLAVVDPSIRGELPPPPPMPAPLTGPYAR